MRGVKKYVLYSAVSIPLDRSKRFTRFALPDRPVHADTNSASPGSILARQELHTKTKSLTFPPLSVARYLFIQLSKLGRQCRERKCPPNLRNGSKWDSNPGSLDCESGILRLSYRAPQLPRVTERTKFRNFKMVAKVTRTRAPSMSCTLLCL